MSELLRIHQTELPVLKKKTHCVNPAMLCGTIEMCIRDSCCAARLIIEHLQDLRFGQGSVLGQPFDHMLLIFQQHNFTSLLYAFSFQMRISFCMRLILLPFVEKGLQFGTVSGDHFFLYFGCLDHHRDLIIVGADQSLTPFKLGNGAHFCAGKLCLLYTSRCV